MINAFLAKLEKKIHCEMTRDPEILNFYSVDASSYSVRPSAIVFPRSEKDVSDILKMAARYKITVTPRGAGTGLAGGDLGSGIIIDMKNFNKIKFGRNFVDVGSGAMKGYIDLALKSRKRFLGPNPSIGPFCTIGGMISTNAAGSHSIKYGSTIDNLLQVRVALSDGRVIDLPREGRAIKEFLATANTKVGKYFPHISKNSCGYRIDKITSDSDAHKIIAGSEGTLGIIISARMRTMPIPKQTVLIVSSYQDLKHGVSDIPKIMNLGPSAVEIIDHNIASHIDLPLSKRKKCLLFIEFDDRAPAKEKKCKRILSGHIVESTRKNSQIARWWRYRNSALSYSLRSVTGSEKVFSIIEDAAVPVHRLPLLLDLIDHLKSKFPMRVIVYGHAGNGNLHVRPILKKKDGRLIKRIAREYFSGVISMGGTISGEHGDGLARSEFVRLQYGPKTYEVFKRLKRHFDPSNTLNPGKIVV
ncbi:MAG: FAD-binding oxidoreductase [Thaumarchaeota archaeon]|nr:FAD-binding oxidoreductase [Nitrososphaerota archaeon]